MSERGIVSFLRLATVIDGRNSRQLVRLLGVSRSTFNRYLSLMRRCGFVVQFDHAANAYHVIDTGPFNLPRLQQAKFDSARQQIISLPRAA
jgi:predicted DNA-binding transcriptional regulator YafY